MCVCVFMFALVQQMKDSMKFINLDVDDVFSSYELFFTLDNIFILSFIIL